MILRPIVAVLALVAAAALAPAAADANATPRVTSSLDGKTVLPHRIRWIAVPHLGGRPPAEVAFLIDGKVSWLEHEAPFTYSEDGGYLVTSFLAPGLHRFTVRVRTASGKHLTDTVRARVIPAPQPPPQLAGKWQRDVPQAVPADPGATGDAAVPAGTWTLIFDRRWAETIAPGTFDPQVSQTTGFGYIIDTDFIPGATTFHLAGAVSIAPQRDADPRGGWWCDNSGPEANYTWSVNGTTLILAPIGGVDACHQRGGIFAGTWTRVA